MKISIIVEGKTEVAFKEPLRCFLEKHIVSEKPKLDFKPQNGRVPKGDKLKRLVEGLLSGPNASDHVIALTDVYTGTSDFSDASDAKNKMKNWVENNPRFHPHAAQHDFEAWLLPYWEAIKRRAEHNRNAPPGANNPETINHNKPPSCWIREIFEAGKKSSYVKPRDAKAILKGKDLSAAISVCPELKAFINTIIMLSGGQQLP